MNTKSAQNRFDEIVSLTKRRGFIFPSSEIYGGFGSSFDYGPLGALMKNKIKREWWKSMVQKRDDIVGLDSAIFMNPKVWTASGHVENFTDPLSDCKKCKKRWRGADLDSNDQCPECKGELTKPRQFNLLMKTHLGPVEDDASIAYLRGETCQGIYVNVHQVAQSMRKKIPFGIAQIGKAFRNEITPRQFLFRMREFEQMEMQFFVKPDQADAWFETLKTERMNWYIRLGIPKEKLRFKEHQPAELAHYAKQAIDIEYEFSFGWNEIEGIHNRGDWDLSRHSKFSGKDLSFRDEETKSLFLPWVIETSAGVDRAFFAFFDAAYATVAGGRTTTTESAKEREIILNLSKYLAPFDIAIFPLLKKAPLQNMAKDIAHDLKKYFFVHYDEDGTIGRRYRRHDEIGTPYCVTIDFQTVEDQTATIRDRDTMKQDRVLISALREFFRKAYECP